MALRDRHTGSNQRKKGLSGKWFLLGTAFVAILGFLGWALHMSSISNIEFNETTLCAKHQQPTELVALLIDVSDTPKPIQVSALKNEISRATRSIDVLGMLQIYSLREMAKGSEVPIFSLCNPGNGDDLNTLYQNPQLARTRWETQYANKLDEILNAELVASSSKTSPIFEGIQRIVVSYLNQPEFDGIDSKRLIVASDLLQHMPGRLSHYEALPSITDISENQYMNSTGSDMRNISVEALYISRPSSNLQGLEHIRFWEAYFANQGGLLSRVVKIPG